MSFLRGGFFGGGGAAGTVDATARTDATQALADAAAAQADATQALTNVAAVKHFSPFVFGNLNAGANLTDQTFGNTSQPPHRGNPGSGTVVGIAYGLDAVPSAGTLTFSVFKDGADTNQDVTITSASTQVGYLPLGTPVTMTASSVLSLKWSTSADWAPGTVDFQAALVLTQ